MKLEAGLPAIKIKKITFQLRYLAAALVIGLVALLAWLLAGPRSAGKMFGLYTPRQLLLLVAAGYSAFWMVYFLLGKQKLKTKVANSILSSASFAFVIGLFELPALFLGADYRLILSPPESRMLTTVKPWNDPHNLMDPELIHIHRPNDHITGETSGDLVYWLGIQTQQKYPVDVQYDALGFRNSHAITQADIAILGDSFAESLLVPQADLLSSQLSRSLQVEVFNLGQSGYGPQQELITLQRYGLPAHPKVVLWLFFEGNDLLDISRYDQQVQDLQKAIQTANTFQARSFTRNLLETLVSLTEPKSTLAMADQRACVVQDLKNQPGQTLYFAYPGEPLSQTDLASLEKAKAVFLQARSVSAANGAQWVLVFVPTKYRVYHDLCTFKANTEISAWQINDLPGRLAAWSKEQNIPYIDLTPALSQAAHQGDLVFFPDDGHWNAAGNKVGSEVISAYLLNSGRPGISSH